MTMAPRTRRRIVIIEDEIMIFFLLEAMLEELGCEALGPVTRLEDALKVAHAEEFDAAILDVNLNSQESYGVATILQARGKPFVFSTGYGAEGLRREFRHAPVLQKPFRREDLSQVLAALRF